MTFETASCVVADRGTVAKMHRRAALRKHPHTWQEDTENATVVTAS